MAAAEIRGDKKFQKSYFDVLGICCPSEVPLIENILKQIDGVKDFSVIVSSRTVIVVHDSVIVSQLQIVKALNQARLEANVRVNGEINHKNQWPNHFAIVSGLFLSISLFKFLYPPLQWLALAAVAAGIYPIALKAFSSITHLRLDINILAIIAVIGTIAMGDYLEAGTIIFLFSISEWLESRASHKASAVMSSLLSLTPQKAIIAETGEEVDVDEVKLNTLLAVKAGEVIPIDGIVVDGNCEVDERTLTGESFPVTKHKDSTVWAGTINLNGYVSVKTTALAEDCVVAKMAELVEEAQNNKSNTQRFIDKCSLYYTPSVVLISAGFAVIPLALRLHNLSHWFHLALVVLVSACPCALILSTPVATSCALFKAAKSGLLIKGGDFLEVLANIKVIAFDKTGTITRAEFVVDEFRSLSHEISFETLMYWVSSIESKSSHPMATALVDHGRSQMIEPKPENVTDYHNFPGEGVYGMIDGQPIYIGNKRIALRAASAVPGGEDDIKGGKSTGYIYCGAVAAGIFSISDGCRTGVAEAIKDLKALGIKTAMLTGDNRATAMHVQAELGNALDIIHAELLPQDKARIINELKQEGPTAMVGDGLNDAPALATADIGISMGISGSALATESGNIILMSNDIRKIPEAVKLARKTYRTVIVNVCFSILTKAAILGLAFAGHPLIWAAVLADVGTCVLVILNSMFLLRENHQHGQKCCRKASSTTISSKNECHGGDHGEHHHHGKCSSKENHRTDHHHGKCSTEKTHGTDHHQDNGHHHHGKCSSDKNHGTDHHQDNGHHHHGKCSSDKNHGTDHHQDNEHRHHGNCSSEKNHETDHHQDNEHRHHGNCSSEKNHETDHHQDNGHHHHGNCSSKNNQEADHHQDNGQHHHGNCSSKKNHITDHHEDNEHHHHGNCSSKKNHVAEAEGFRKLRSCSGITRDKSGNLCSSVDLEKCIQEENNIHCGSSCSKDEPLLIVIE